MRRRREALRPVVVLRGGEKYISPAWHIIYRKVASPLWARPPLWATQENSAFRPRARLPGLLVEKEVQSYKKMYSRVRIRTSKRDFGSQRHRRSLRSSDEPEQRL